MKNCGLEFETVAGTGNRPSLFALARFPRGGRQREGVTLLLVILILAAILSISIGIFDLTFGEIRISGEVGDSFLALYAADQGIEKTLYDDRVANTLCPVSGSCAYGPVKLPAFPNGSCATVRLSRTGGGDTIVTATGEYRCSSPVASVKQALLTTYSKTSGGATDTTPPVANILSPAAGSILSGTVTVSAAATDDIGVVGVQFKLDGANLGAEDTTSPYSVAWDTTATSDGSHTITAVARDAAGNQGTSGAVTYTVSNSGGGGPSDTTPPVANITGPAAGSILSGSVTVSAAATDNVGVVGVQFKLDGANLDAEDTTSPYSVVWNTTATTNGSHNVTAVARDAAGNLGTSGAVTYTVSNGPPPISRWRMNEASGSTVADSADGNNGTAVGTTIVGGISGNARSFSAAADKVTFGDILDSTLSGSYTISAWIKTSSSAFGRIIDKTPAVSPNELYIYVSADKVTFGVTDSASEVVSTQSVTGGAWHNTIFVRDTSTSPNPTLKIYIDGVLDNSRSNGQSPGNNPDPLTIGNAAFTTGQQFPGTIDEVAVYGTVLTDAQICNLYKATSGRTSCP